MSLGLESEELSLNMSGTEANVLQGLESEELSLNMTRGPEASVLHAYLTQANDEPRSRERGIITKYDKRTKSQCPPCPLV